MSATTTRVFASILERQQPWQRLGTSTLFVSGLYALMLVGALLARSPVSAPKGKVREELVVTLLDLPKLSELRDVKSEGRGDNSEAGAARAAAVTVPVRADSSRGLGRLPRATPRAKVPSDPSPTPSAEQTQPHEATSANIETASSSASSATPQSSAAASTASEGTATSAGSGGAGGNATNVGTGSAGASGTKSGSGANDSSAMPFMDGMTRPTLLAKVDPSYTREARDAEVAGLILSKCVITTEGRLVRCRIVKGIPLMDQAVLTALAQWRYSPVLYQGKPVAVDYVIPVRLVLP